MDEAKLEIRSCPKCGAAAKATADEFDIGVVCPKCGEAGVFPKAASDGPPVARPVHGVAGEASASGTSADDAVSTIIPYKNAAALIAYYLAVFSLIPCIGLFLGIAAFICGIIGLRKAKAMPSAKGKVHAWIGIIVGGLFALVWLAAIIWVIVNMNANRYWAR